MSKKGWDGIFADPEVGRILRANGKIADANKSSIEELATITSLSGYFYYNQDITQFPELRYCTGLTSLYEAFYGCRNLTKAPVIPSSVTSLSSTFRDCPSLTTAPTIPSSVTDLTHTFSSCTSLTTAPDIPEGVTSLNSTFYGCTSLTTASIIPSSVTNLRETFYYCLSIDGIYIINAVTPPTYYNTFGYTNVQAIYVPDASVSAYKSTYGWRDFADKIFPMSNKPQ